MLPNMNSLHLAVLNTSYPSISEFPILDRILPGATGLQNLSLQPLLGVGRPGWERLGKESRELRGPLHLVTPLVHCRLESLTLRGQIFMNDWPQTLLPWISAMDWAQLKYLDLDDAAYPAIIVGLSGKVPRLGSLRLGHPDDRHTHTSPARWDCLKSFLIAAPKLRSISLVNRTASKFQHLLDTVLSCVGPNLHSLDIISSPHLSSRFICNTAQLWELCSMAPNLRELAIELDPDNDHEPLSLDLAKPTEESWVREHDHMAERRQIH